MSLSLERVTEREGIADGVALWNEHVPAFYVEDWQVEQDVLAPFDGVTVRCYAARDGDDTRAFAVVKRLSEGAGEYHPTDRGWLSLFAFDPDAEDGAAAGRELLDHVADELRDAGKTTLAFGQGPQNLLAGVPDELPDAYVRVLDDAGFEFGSVVHDLERPISGYTVPERHRETAREWPGLDLVPATGRTDDLLAFLADQFPGRWYYETTNVRRVPGGPRDYWLLEHEGTVVGSLRANRHDGAYRAHNVNWGARLAAAHCGVGQVGIHEDYRGRGWGLYMIAGVLERLAADGYDHCVVDWTTIPGYYEKLGFERWLSYRTATLDLTA